MRKNFGGWWIEVGRPTVYRAYGWAGELLYVGCTANPRVRLRAHRQPTILAENPIYNIIGRSAN